MPDITLEPATVPVAPADFGFVQTVRLLDGKRVIGAARWHSGTSAAEGVIQITDVFVSPEHRRQGNGARLLKEIYKQATAYFRGQKSKLRRAWIAVEQKHQVIARAFLTENGFHHVATIPELLKDEDLLVYSRTFD